MPEITAKQVNVLLIEDNDISNFLSSNTLNEIGIEKIDIAENGQLAFSYLQKRCPDIIFLDLNMPVMDGFEFLDLSHKKCLCGNTLIAILSSSLRKSDKDKAMSFSSVIDYFEKPLDTEKVEKMLIKLSSQNFINN